MESTKISNDTQNKTKIHRGLQVIEISSRNASDNTSSPKTRMKRLDDNEDSSLSTTPSKPDSQKLIFYPSRTLKPPRTSQKTKAIHYNSLPPNHKISSRRILIPRAPPHNHRSTGFIGRPHAFLHPPSGQPILYSKIKNNDEIYPTHRVFQNHNYSPQMPANAIQLKGTYRHPRKNGDLSKFLHQGEFSANNLISPYEINQMMNFNTGVDGKMPTTLQPHAEQNYFRRKFRQQIASIPNYNIHARDAENIYGNVLQSAYPSTVNQQQQHRHVTERNEQQQHPGNPFSVMLDVYPMMGDEIDYHKLQQQQQSLKMRPLMSRYYQDPQQVFNTMNFPQVMHRYPPSNSYFRFQPQPQASNNYGIVHSNGMMKQHPSQIVVHLNLYPKNSNSNNSNNNSYQRSSNEDVEVVKGKKSRQHKNFKLNLKQNQTSSDTPLNINFNLNTGNGHPENIMHRINQSSTETSMVNSYYYDDEDDMAADQSNNVPPSLVYKNIHRERPFHYEFLKNTTLRSTTTKPQFIKPQNNSKYKLIDRSRKTSPPPPSQKNQQRKFFGPFY